MLSLRNFLRWCSYMFLVQVHMQSVNGAWPSSNSSTIQLLGIFHNELNTTEATSWFFQSRAMFMSAIVLARQYNIQIRGEYLDWAFVTTRGNTMTALRSTCQSISASNIVGLVGPTVSREAHVLASFAEDLAIPVVSYSATDPELSNRKTYPTFYRTVPSDNDAALAIAKLFLKFNWTSAIIIYQNDAFGSGGAKVISEAFSNNKLAVTEMIVFDMTTKMIRGDLKNALMRSITRIVILWTESNHATSILQEALQSNVLGPQFTWIIGAEVTLSSFDTKWHDKLTGMLTIGPVVGDVVHAPINRTLLNDAYSVWQKYEPESFPGANNVDYYALFTFDATWLLIKSFEQLCSDTTSSPCVLFANSSFCFDRHVLNSNRLFDIINSNAFLGVSGPVQFGVNATDRVNGSYYVVKNVQSFADSSNYVPVLVSTGSGDWTSQGQTNVIVWPGKSLTAPSGYAAIAGVTLRIAVIETAPFTMLREITDAYGRVTTKMVGYVPDLLELLQQKMGFIPNITILPSNQTYNELVDAIANGVFDMVVGDMTIMSKRREKVAFSDSIFDNSLRIIVRKKSSETVDLLAFTKPFSYKLWLLILGAILWSAFLLHFYEGLGHEELKDKSIPSRIAMSIWFSIGTLVGYGVDFHVKTAAGRLLTAGLYILSLVLVAAFTANLTSSLTVLKTQDFISGIDDIKNGQLSFSRIGIISGSSIENYFLREISDGSRNYYPLKSKDDMYEKLLNRFIDASIMDVGALEYSTNAIYCNLTLVGTAFDYSAFGIAYPKQWLHEQILDVTILSLRESDVFTELKSKWFQTNNCSSLSERTTPDISFESLAGLFATFGGISILSLFLFAWFKVKEWMKNQRHTIRENVGNAETRIEMQTPSNRSISERPLFTLTGSPNVR